MGRETSDCTSFASLAICSLNEFFAAFDFSRALPLPVAIFSASGGCLISKPNSFIVFSDLSQSATFSLGVLELGPS
jgi:hypothetical protein